MVLVQLLMRWTVVREAGRRDLGAFLNARDLGVNRRHLVRCPRSSHQRGQR